MVPTISYLCLTTQQKPDTYLYWHKQTSFLLTKLCEYEREEREVTEGGHEDVDAGVSSPLQNQQAATAEHGHILVCSHLISLGTHFLWFKRMDMFMDIWIHGFQTKLNIIEVNKIFHCDIKFMNCLTHKIHTIKCPMNKNDFTWL